MFGIQVAFWRRTISAIANQVESAFNMLLAQGFSDDKISLTAGSRGIHNITPVITAAAGFLRSRGARPLAVAAMGSHGGGTSEGQRKLLAHLGITEETIGAPILTDMDVVELGRTPSGLIAYCDRNAAECDGILVINRIKPHTGFAEPFGSGLLKMLAVGLGKVPGAAQIHRQGPAQMAQAIEDIARVFIDSGKVIGGLAIIENAYDETAEIVAVRPEEMIEKEKELFQRAKAMMPRLPVEDIDVLIVDEIGKNYSGSGMDVNVIGRWRLPGMPEPTSPRVQRIVALRLSPESDGNAQGVGLADFVTRRLVDAMDPVNTYMNTITSTFLQRGFIPITMPTDRDAIASALSSLALPDTSQARIVRIPNTLHLDRLWVSEPLLPELRGRSEITVGSSEILRFTADGMLADLA